MIAVIIPTYNPGMYLEECLNALHSQDIDPILFKVYVIFNGTDEEVIQDFKERISLYKFSCEIYSVKNPGVSNARNLGINVSKEKYLCFIDDDDVISNNYLTSLLEQVEDSTIVVSNVYSFERCISEHIIDYLSFNNSFSTSNILGKRKYLSNACCKLIPRAIIDDIKFNTFLTQSEDALFMFEISKNIKFINSSDINAIYYRRIRFNSASRKKLLLHKKIVLLCQKFILFSFVYFKNFYEYSFLLYLTRILAIFKSFFLSFKN